MTHNIQQFGKAMTALAAVLAFSSTPLLAQDMAPPEADTSVEPAAPDPLAPEPAATQEAAPPAPQPKVETSRIETERAEPRASSPTRSTVRRASTAAPASTAPAPALDAAEPAPVPAEPQPPLTAPEPAAPPPAVAQAPATATPDSLGSDLLADDALPIAGAAALGLLALGGAGLVARRRKRRRENAEFEARQQALAMIADEPALEPEARDEVRPGPAFARSPTPIHDPVPATGSPEGFDPSRFGRHVQAAYSGPTDDNPSVSLEYRLRRGAAMDQQERELAGQAQAETASATPAKIPGHGSWASRPDGDFLIRRAGKDAKRPVEHK